EGLPDAIAHPLDVAIAHVGAVLLLRVAHPGDDPPGDAQDDRDHDGADDAEHHRPLPVDLGDRNARQLRQHDREIDADADHADDQTRPDIAFRVAHGILRMSKILYISDDNERVSAMSRIFYISPVRASR